MLNHLTVIDAYGRDYQLSGGMAPRSVRSGLRLDGLLSRSDVPWTARLAEDARFGIVGNSSSTRASSPSTPALVSIPIRGGQSLTLGSNISVGSISAMAGSPLRGISSTPVGTTVQWSGKGWFATAGAGQSRDGRLNMRTVGLRMPIGVGFELIDFDEDGHVLGMRGGPTIGIGGANTAMASVTVDRTVSGFNFTGRASLARTRVLGASSILSFSQRLIGTAFSLEAGHALLGGAANMALSSPLKLERARAILRQPDTYDLITGATTERLTVLDLAPDRRELDFALSWSTSLSPTSSFRIGLLRAFNSGNVAGVADSAAFFSLVLR